MDTKEFVIELRNYRSYANKLEALKDQVKVLRNSLEGLKSASPLLNENKGGYLEPEVKYVDILEKIKAIEDSRDYVYYLNYFLRVDSILNKLSGFERKMFMDIYTSKNPHSWRHWQRESGEDYCSVEAFYKRKMSVLKNLDLS